MKKILVIDDEEHVRSFLRRILSKAGYEVFLSSNGEEAVKQLEQITVDLIMLDMNMPRMNGLQFLAYLRDNNITSAPVLMISGSDDIEQRVESYKLGAYDFIEKPEHNEVMLKRVENGLKIGDMIHFNEFIKTELFMAKKLQNYLFPQENLDTEMLNIRTRSFPLSDIGGDLYDYIEFRDGRVFFFVADVSGHSISAALYTAIVSMVFRNALKSTNDPGLVLEKMNRELAASMPVESFVTMFCGLIDPVNSKLYYSNAGHPCPHIICGGELKQLPGSNPFLGPIPEASYETYEHDIHKGESILIVTDGILDVKHVNDIKGVDLIHRFFSEKNISPAGRFENFFEYITGSEVKILDDCTVMLVQVK